MEADYYYDIVAFYQPTSPPAVTGPSLDKRGLLVRPKVTPVAELKQKGYVKGLQIAMKNNKTCSPDETASPRFRKEPRGCLFRYRGGA